MDVLTIIKADHDQIREHFSNLAKLDGVKRRRSAMDELAAHLEVHLILENDYLFPEVQGLFSGSETLVKASQATTATIQRKLKALVRMVTRPVAEQTKFAEKLAELANLIDAHFGKEEEVYMPKIRTLIRTEEREDLGQVFVEAKEEVIAGRSQTARQRKRA